ncbi:zinc finger protein ZPR1 [Ursus maritimus]|uniref:Zinc finger protein ZPR1 n=1 Tax=Ursus maritimus TaxID=29073 RepID=A0A384C1F2_URSMA|nr:zinc finger protein ZPR1 [Ursus maritimus]XP_008688265.1 zinc finger protein ZPR1 [Ursus maritimus]XP_026361495.1 zinc finger protein ZPR1 [Ursus arctos]XP_057172622.1 zinc finger protein ZPR1 [Ursus arctos]
MAVSGAVEPGSPAPTAAPSPAPAGAPAPEHLFRPISAEDEEQQPTEIESLCMNCYRNGTTRLLLTKIPFFREIIVSSFSCEHCGWNNTEIQSAGRIQDQGVRYTLTVRAQEDMNREVVKTDSATTRIPELDFEIPAFSQKGALTTVEGLISRAISGLEQDQPARRANEEAVAERIDEFIVKLKELKQVASPFTLIIDDPSGNSFVENPHAPQKDHALVITHYNRTVQQEEMLGLQAEAPPEEKPEEEDLRNEVLQFNTNCPECNAPAQTNMKLVQIPHFKEVIIMATNCENCGHRTNEVKSGGAVEPLGTKITFHITDPLALTRDVLKSETCSVEIPELEFELGMAVLGGKFTTLEGLLKDIQELVTKNPFTLGDSSNPGQMEKLQEFSQKLDQILQGKMKAHFIMNDPAGNSYFQNVYAPEDDPQMKVEHYKRTFDQNEELGLNDMKTEGYETGLAPQR